VLQALGERTAWEKALFLLAAHPRLGGKTPVEVLHEKPSPDLLDRLYLLAQHAAEMGTQEWRGGRTNHQRVRRQARPGPYPSSIAAGTVLYRLTRVQVPESAHFGRISACA
jgi:hypothetical protein